ncbi:MAG: DUF192 domain-containing protein [Caldilineaceae bacterium]
MLQVTNITRHTKLIDKGRVARNPWTRLKGLIGVRHLAAGDGLLITRCKGVHCMFMSIPIDVLYVNKQDQVVAIDEAMPPWAVGRVRRHSHYVLELPAGTAAQSGTGVGDQLQVERRK